MLDSFRIAAVLVWCKEQQRGRLFACRGVRLAEAAKAGFDVMIRGLFMTAHAPQATIALPNGTLIRSVNGDDLRYLSETPHTAMLQTLKPVRGRCPSEWPALGRKGQVVVSDSSICKYQIGRIKRLRDGRYIALGQAWPYRGGGRSGQCVSKSEATDMLLSASAAQRASGGGDARHPGVGIGG